MAVPGCTGVGGGRQVTLTVRGTCYANEHNHANWKAFHGVAPYLELDNRRQATWIVLYWIHPTCTKTVIWVSSPGNGVVTVPSLRGSG